MGNARNLGSLLNTSSTIQADDLDIGQFGNRNLIINGAMQIAQRGTSFTNPSSSAYTLDRWILFHSHDGAVDVSQSTAAPAGLKNSLKLDVTTEDSSLSSAQYYILATILEGQNLSHLNYGSADAKEVTISFWVRSNKTGTYYVEIQTSGSQELARPYTINTANTWEHKTLTWSANTDFAITETNAAGISLYWWLAAGSDYTGSPIATTWGSHSNRVPGQTNFLDSTNNEFYITGVQLEAGDTATPFEHHSFGQELALCQRYFEKSFNQSVVPQNSANTTSLPPGFNTGTIGQGNYGQNMSLLFKVPKRAAPTMVYYGNSNGHIWRYRYDNGNTGYINSWASSSSENGVRVYPFESGLNLLVFDFTASAEL